MNQQAIQIAVDSHNNYAIHSECERKVKEIFSSRFYLPRWSNSTLAAINIPDKMEEREKHTNN